MGIRIYSNSFSNPEYYSYSYSLKVDSTNNIRIRIRVKIIIRDNTGPDWPGPARSRSPGSCSRRSELPARTRER